MRHDRELLGLQSGLLAVLVAAGALLASPVFAAEGKNRYVDEFITFEVNVVPEDPFDVSYQANGKAVPFQARRGQVVKVIITGTPKKGWHTYPVTLKGPKQGDFLSELTFPKVNGLIALPPLIESKPELVKDIYEYDHTFTWTQDVAILPDAAPGNLVLPIKIFGQVCDDRCMRFDCKLEATVSVSTQDAVPLTPALTKRVEDAKAKYTAKVKTAPSSGDSQGEGLLSGTHEEYKATMESLAKRMVNKIESNSEDGADLLSFILAGIFWGAISLVTPCVFPMIPITVSYFLKQSEKEHHRPVRMALIYSATIVIVLTVAAAFLLSAFRLLSINPIMNYALGGLFIFFALSLFGMYEIELPSGLARFTSAREGQGGTVGVIFMALTFTIISFACVAPFLGGFGGTAATQARPLWHNLLGGLAFSATFAAPFFLLAIFPALLRKLPKSGSWLNSVKVVMGFLELAAAFKFFRAAELLQTSSPTLFTFDLCLGVYVALCLLCGLYLLGFYRLPHDTPEDHISVPRLVFSGLFLALGLYLMPALFKLNSDGIPQRPTGAVYAWVDSFLLPEARPSHGSKHTGNLAWAVAQAQEHRRKTGQTQYIFLDHTGKSCTNCNLNEHNVFSKPEFRKLFEKYLVVQLYTDIVPDEFYNADLRASFNGDTSRQKADAREVNFAFQETVFNNIQLPLYAILEVREDGRIDVVAVYREGLINNEAAFAQLLRDPK